MNTAASIVIALVALLHVYFLVIEMFLWDKPAGLRVFGQTKEEASASKTLAANQGLYNGFLAARRRGTGAVIAGLIHRSTSTRFVPVAIRLEDRHIGGTTPVNASLMYGVVMM